ncbi:MAG TPA: hypothetical protein VFG21_02500 [Xanthomonadaceae bacterium]|nr:hypothetical protein [Xanthomonadaceae bacterium]
MRTHRSLIHMLLMAAGCAAGAAHGARPQYDVDYHVRFLPDRGQAEVTISVAPDEARITLLDFNMPPSRYSDATGDGKVERKGDRVVWTPPVDGGQFRYRHSIDHKRGSGYDAHITPDWVIARGDDIIPPARVRITRGGDSRARLRFELPPDWTTVDTQYRRSRDGSSFVVVNSERRFDRPTGWMIAGKLGVRLERLDGSLVSVAAPKGQAYPRLEILGYVNAVLPELEHLGGRLPTKLLIVGGGDPMWRGGLSGTRSLWLHADRPMISENGTSPLLHELFHVTTRISGAKHEDWIAEGLAEYYSIELLYRASLLSPERRDLGLDWMRSHGRKIKTLRARQSQGPRTARAVALFADLDREIRERTDEEKSLDDVVRRLVQLRQVSRPELDEVVEALLGGPSRSLDTPVLQ